MRKIKISKKSMVILVVLFTIMVVVKMHQFYIVNQLSHAIEKFRCEENRYYSVIVISNNNKYKDEIFAKDRIVKYVIDENQHDVLYYEWKNFENNKQFSYKIDDNLIYNNEILIKNENFLTNLPNTLFSKKLNFIMKLTKILDVYYIIPTKYENKNCYKIVGKTEELIIDKQTYFPVYAKTRISNSEKTEKIYEFKINEVTEEDVLCPDLENNSNIEEK